MEVLAFLVKAEKDMQEPTSEEEFLKLLSAAFEWAAVRHSQCAGKSLPNQCEKCQWKAAFHDARNGIGGTNVVFKLLADKPVAAQWSGSKKQARAVRQGKKARDDASSASGRVPVKPKVSKKSELRKMVSSQLKAKSEDGKLNSIVASAVQVTGEIRNKRIAEVDKLLASLSLDNNTISYGKREQEFNDDLSKLGLYGVLAAQGEGVAKFGLAKVVKGKSGSCSSSSFADALCAASAKVDSDSESASESETPLQDDDGDGGNENE